MKFLHTGDIHYGMKPDSDKPWGKERAQAVKDSLQKIVNLCKEKEVDLLLIAGDLFHNQPLGRDLKEVNFLFSTIPDTKVVIIAGNHDCIRENSPIPTFPWAKNVVYLSSYTIGSVYFRDINTEVYGFSYNDREIRENIIAGLSLRENDRIKILLLHGGDAAHLPFDKAALNAISSSYVALGHIHKHEVLYEKHMAYCGSPEPLDMTESGDHGVYLGEINDQTGKVTSLEFLPVSTTSYISLTINVTPETTNAELVASLSEAITKRGAQNIYRFRILGLRDPETEFDLESLGPKLRIAEIQDESEPKYDFAKLFAEHPSDMIAFFIRELDRPNMSKLDKKALYYGINALLRTTDERGKS